MIVTRGFIYTVWIRLCIKFLRKHFSVKIVRSGRRKSEIIFKISRGRGWLRPRRKLLNRKMTRNRSQMTTRNTINIITCFSRRRKRQGRSSSGRERKRGKRRRRRRRKRVQNCWPLKRTRRISLSRESLRSARRTMNFMRWQRRQLTNSKPTSRKISNFSNFSTTSVKRRAKRLKMRKNQFNWTKFRCS